MATVKKQYICFDIIENCIDNLEWDDILESAKEYQYFLEVVLPAESEAFGKQIGTLDLTKKK